MQKGAIVRVVKAAKIANKLSETICELTGGQTDNLADRIFGLLADSLFLYCGEKNPDDFGKTKTYRLLNEDDRTDSEIADEFIRIAEANKPKQPAPILMTQEEHDALYGTPEGEWR